MSKLVKFIIFKIFYYIQNFKLFVGEKKSVNTKNKLLRKINLMYIKLILCHRSV